MNYFINICRICMSTDNDLINIYHSDDDMITYIDKLNTCIPEIFTADNYIPLPDQICEICCKNLKIVFWFRELCLKSNNLLRSYKLKEEDCDKYQESEDINLMLKHEDVIVKPEISILCESEDLMNVKLKTEENEKESTNAAVISNNVETVLSFAATDPKQKKHLCSFCGKPFKYRQDMRVHERIHTGHKPYACTICSKTFAKSTRLKLHMNTHTREKAFPCPVCGKSFKQSSNLNVHLKLHSQTERFKCDLCEKTFSQKRHLKQHVLFHENERRYTCDVCNWNFTMKHHLKRHMMTHTGQRPQRKELPRERERQFPCTQCDWKFMSKEVLKRHMEIHAREDSKLRTSLNDEKRRFPCPMCVWSFTKKHHLQRHMIKHQENRKFSCNICNEEFKKNYELQRHMKFSHSDENLQGIPIL